MCTRVPWHIVRTQGQAAATRCCCYQLPYTKLCSQHFPCIMRKALFFYANFKEKETRMYAVQELAPGHQLSNWDVILCQAAKPSVRSAPCPGADAWASLSPSTLQLTSSLFPPASPLRLSEALPRRHITFYCTRLGAQHSIRHPLDVSSNECGT